MCMKGGSRNTQGGESKDAVLKEQHDAVIY